ncbi:hypothetical protein ACFO0M_25190 [Micromonospora mangrovi]|uniref:Uncharacterized protein n=2 Tax=Micromonospora TaxID=1873 RepID=A0AAU8HH30_9ACTN
MTMFLRTPPLAAHRHVDVVDPPPLPRRIDLRGRVGSPGPGGVA